MKRHRGRLHRLLDRLLDLTSKRTRTASTGSSRARIRTSTSGGCATKAATAITTCTATERLTSAAAPRGRRAGRCSNGRRPAGEIDERLRGGRPAGRGALAASDGRRSLPAGQVRPRHRSAGACWRWGRCRSWAKTRRSRTASRFAPRSARIAAASRRSSAISCGRVATFDELLAGDRSRRDRRACGSRGGYKRDWIDDADGRAVRGGRAAWSCRICSPRRCGERATYQLPGAAFAERDGSYVNHADRLQSGRLGDSPAGGRAGRGQRVLASCSASPGLYNAATRAGRSGRARSLYFAAAGGRSRVGRRFEGRILKAGATGRDRDRRSEA